MERRDGGRRKIRTGEGASGRGRRRGKKNLRGLAASGWLQAAEPKIGCLWSSKLLATQGVLRWSRPLRGAMIRRAARRLAKIRMPFYKQIHASSEWFHPCERLALRVN